MAAGQGATIFNKPSDRQVAIVRDFSGTRRAVFDAWTNPAHLPHWMTGPDGWSMTVCERDLRPGGEHRSVWRHRDGSQMEIRGVFREIRPPQRIVFSESWGGSWPETANTITLVEQQGQTTMTLMIVYPSSEARDAALASGMKDGLSVNFDHLDQYLRGMAEQGADKATA